VYANIMVGSVAPVAYVGAVRVRVVNNTIYQPEKWVARILQETVDPNRFLPCGDNTFENNIIVVGNNVSTTINIGPNTDAGSFVFAHNLWYHTDNSNWGGPILPVTEQGQIKNQNPLLANPANRDFTIPTNSPASAKGKKVAEPIFDYYNKRFANPPSIGAVEANPVSKTMESTDGLLSSLLVFPNPVSELLTISYQLERPVEPMVEVFTALGNKVGEYCLSEQWPGHHVYTLPVQQYQGGLYCLSIKIAGKVEGSRWFIVNK
jgi:hypothetical protein